MNANELRDDRPIGIELFAERGTRPSGLYNNLLTLVSEFADIDDASLADRGRGIWGIGIDARVTDDERDGLLRALASFRTAAATDDLLVDGIHIERTTYAW